ncbi:MAG TPA: nucleoside triphosphate pyrophosphatase [Candidatus Acidoferrales bacterium]|nr:nucleoside triphosphate pyrophosphatase [Candidatus Acidoferrales bacterium]
MRIVLASASPRRLELLRSLGLEVEIVLGGYGEPPLPGLEPRELARIHAREKLRAALTCVADRSVPVVAADTVVDLDGEALGKPLDAADAARMLGLLSGREHRVHTAYALAPGADRPWVEACDSTDVQFWPLTADEIEEYVATGEPLDKAGAYGIQGRAAALVASIRGDFYTVMGFPLGPFIRTLRRLGFALPPAK